MATPQVPALLHKMSVSSQKAWYKKNKIELPAHLKPVSAAQAKKADKPTGTKELERKSLQAYGATKGTKVGEIGGEKAAGDKDTVKPLSPEQHSKVQAAIKAAKGAVTTKRAPIKSKEDRLSFIKAAVAKAKSPKRAERFDVATLDNNDEHDNIRHDHDLMHSVGVRHSYNEEVEQLDERKEVTHEDPLVTVHDKHGLHTHANLSTANRIFGTSVKHTNVHAGPVKTSSESGKDLTFALSKHHAKEVVKEAEQIDERNVENKNKKDQYVRSQGLKAMKAGKVDPARGHSPTRFGREELKNEEVENKEESETSAGGQEMSLAQKLAQKAMKSKKETPGADVPADKQIAQQMGEEADKEGDDREYDYEGEMAKTQLKGILKHAQNLHDSLEDDTNLPEWVQSKITLAHDYIQTASDYMDAQDDEGEDLDEEVQNIDEKYMGFKALKASIAARGGARDPGAVAAAIGRKKYGKAAFQKAAAKGEKMEEALDPVGKEDKDVDNDGKVDSTDKYLLNRRAAVAKAIKSKMAKKLGK